MLLNETKEKLDIIILAGQSNGEGYGIGPCEAPFCPTTKILAMRDTDNQGYIKDETHFPDFQMRPPRDYLIAIAEERLGIRGKIGNLGVYFARRYKEELLEEDRRVLIIHAAVGATGFAKGDWGLNAILYNRLVEMTELALSMNKENRVVAFLWHQGEQDAIFNEDFTEKERFDFYFNKLSLQLQDYRKRFGNMPFISAGFTDEWSATCPNSEIIKNALISVTKEHERAAFVSSAGLLSNNQQLQNEDKIHFSRNSQYKLGERYFDAYKSLV